MMQATQQRIHGFRNHSNCVSLNQLLRGVSGWHFSVENRLRSASRRRCLALSSRPWRLRSRRCLPASGGFTKSSSTATAFRSIWPTRPSKIFTRRGHDWTHRFKKVAHDAWRIKASSAVVDGEIVVPAADGTTDFSVLQNELKGKSKKIVLVAFDLLYLNGRDLRKLPLFQSEGRTQEDRRRHRHPVQRELRDRGTRDVRARL